jgi:predicted nucleic acid-binding protein
LATGDGSVVTLDTNIAIYAFTDLDPKAGIAANILAKADFISVQLLNEFANVMRKKRGLEFERISIMVRQLTETISAVHPLDKSANDYALLIAGRYGLSVYDSLMIAVALSGGATTLYSEDMQPGFVIDDRLTITNPFMETV